MKALTELILTFDFVQRCSRIIRINRISVIEMLILDVLIVSKAYRQYILPHSNFFTYYFSHLKYAHGPPGCWALHGLLFHKVNSVQEACAKCFAVQVLKFEILQITWKNETKNIRPLVFSFSSKLLAFWSFLFCFFMWLQDFKF